MSIILPIARVEQELSRSGRGMCPERVERDESADQGGRRSQPLDSCDAEVVDEGRDAEDGKGCLFHDDQWQSQNMTSSRQREAGRPVRLAVSSRPPAC